jgi:hypothetical protein
MEFTDLLEIAEDLARGRVKCMDESAIFNGFTVTAPALASTPDALVFAVALVMNTEPEDHDHVIPVAQLILRAMRAAMLVQADRRQLRDRNANEDDYSDCAYG